MRLTVAARATALLLCAAALACSEAAVICRAHADCDCGSCVDGTCVTDPAALNSCGRCGPESLCLEPVDAGGGVDAGFPAGVWSHIETEPRPSARTYPLCAFDGERLVYVFGGVADNGATTRFNDLWSLDTETWQWRQVWREEAQSTPPFPSPRYAGAAAVHDGSLYLLGGLHQLQGYDSFEIWRYDLGADTWEAIRSSTDPSAVRSNAWFASAQDPDRNSIWLYGGMATTMDESLAPFFFAHRLISGLTETQVITNTDDTQYMVEGHAMVLLHQETEPRLLVFGGVEGKRFADACDARDETWEYDPANGFWSNLPIPLADRPPDRTEHSWTALPGDRAILFGGRAAHCLGEPLDDLWLYRHEITSWTHLTPQGSARPPARLGHCALAIKGGAALLVFGGQNLSRDHNDTWVYVLP